MFNSGQLITLIGDTGLGKTAFIQYLVVRLPKIKTLFIPTINAFFSTKNYVFFLHCLVKSEDPSKKEL